MDVRVSVNVGGCPRYTDFRGILVDACRPESDDVGVGWGKDWGQIGCLPAHGDVASDHDGLHGIAGCVHPVEGYHALLPDLGINLTAERNTGALGDRRTRPPNAGREAGAHPRAVWGSRKASTPPW